MSLKKHSSTHSSGIIQSKHIKESILLFITVIILSDVNANIAKIVIVTFQML